ncbi:MAG: YcaO-like family protein, partial [Acidobacteriota bacterium]
RALAELAVTMTFVRGELRRYGGRTPVASAEAVTDMGAHGRLYARADVATRLDPWWEGESTVELPTSCRSSEPSEAAKPWPVLAGLRDRLAAADLEIIVVDLTPPEIHDLGLTVVKVLVPGTYPMNFDSRWPHFGGKRIATAPVTAGLRAHPLGIESFERFPHPFP